MPERLIDANALIQNYCGACANKEFCAEESCPYYEIRRRIECAPTIEPKRGEWIDDRTDIICSNCKTGFNYEMLLFIREALESGTVDGMECCTE